MTRADDPRQGGYLGVDMGGSTTRAHLISEGAARDCTAPGGNIALDPGAALDILLPILRDTVPQAAVLGLAGARTAPDAVAWLTGEFAGQGWQVTLTTDADLALAAAFGPDADGIALCAGTGSVAVVRIEGRVELVGGHGYLLDDAGSAYDIGRRLVAAALRERDRGDEALADELAGALGEPVDAFVRRVYLAPGDRAPLARLAERVPAMRHPAAHGILQQAADALVALATLAQQRFGPLPVRLLGGVFQSEVIAETLRARCDASPARTRPEVAAARLAAGGAA